MKIIQILSTSVILILLSNYSYSHSEYTFSEPITPIPNEECLKVLNDGNVLSFEVDDFKTFKMIKSDIMFGDHIYYIIRNMEYTEEFDKTIKTNVKIINIDKSFMMCVSKRKITETVFE